MAGLKSDEAAASRAQKALVRLALIDPIELCNEAKIERCRATRDLRSCGRYVRRVLISCGHAALCEECTPRCDVCPICRVPIKGGGNELPLRLYYECIEAGLISKRCDDRLQDREDVENQLHADVQRLYSLFDVSLENNLFSLICHYVTDVCMDQSAVSSDPIVAFLLDERVVRDWCKQTFKGFLTELRQIYNLPENEIKEKLNSLLKICSKLAGISNVLEALESSFRGPISTVVVELNHLQDSVLKTKQHLEIMMWCIRHHFLGSINSRHSSVASWNLAVRERRSEANKRAWPDSVGRISDTNKRNKSSLFVEDALSNIDTEQGFDDTYDGELAITSLLASSGNSLYRSRLDGMAGCYPFENLRAAVDLLFLQGKSDLVLAKQAILLYYLFDRHWGRPDDEWRFIIDDFAVTFGITRHSLLESFVFYLLDDHTDDALKEACRLLPEVVNPNIHPKVAQILLERGNPDAALMVLRWSGREGGATLCSIEEAATAVRVRLECGLLTEAFMYQRSMCTKVKDKKLTEVVHEMNDEQYDWKMWSEVLVREICCLCIRSKLVDRMPELPWNSDEEKHLHKCLLDFARDDPSSTIGSLLVVFYLQRHRYVDAYQVDCELQVLEKDFLSKNRSDEISYKMQSMIHWRKGLVSNGIELLPDVVQKQVKTGNFSSKVVGSFPDNENTPKNKDFPKEQEPVLGSLLFKF